MMRMQNGELQGQVGSILSGMNPRVVRNMCRSDMRSE